MHHVDHRHGVERLPRPAGRLAGHAQRSLVDAEAAECGVAGIDRILADVDADALAKTSGTRKQVQQQPVAAADVENTGLRGDCIKQPFERADPRPMRRQEARESTERARVFPCPGEHRGGVGLVRRRGRCHRRDSFRRCVAVAESERRVARPTRQCAAMRTGQAAATKARPTPTASSRLALSRSAKSTGSSCSLPRTARSQTRPSHRSSNGGIAHSHSGRA